MAGKPNAWGEPADTVRRVRGALGVARKLVEGLLQADFDVTYAYKPLHHPGLAHAFLNTLLYLDCDRSGFDWPVIAMPLNRYGRKVVGAKGFMTSMAAEIAPDPWSSWSHAFLVDHPQRLWPDTAADRRLYEAITGRRHEAWLAAPLADIERAGQQELLNWYTGLGAVDELGLRMQWRGFVETHCFNANKVFAVWR